MTRIIQSLSDISTDYDVLFCDLWGCLHNGVTAFPTAVAALQQFRAGGGKVVLLTNAPRPNGAVIQSLERLGVPRDCYDLVVSSGDAAQEALMAGMVGRRVYHLGPEKDLSFFTELDQSLVNAAPISLVPLDQAEGIVCTGPFDDLNDTPEDYRGSFLQAKARGLKLLCANPDLIVDLGDRRIFCAGALAQLYDEMGGESLYFGKPHPPIYDLARRRLAASGISSDRILCIGDGITTDIQGGQAESLDTLFITGGIAAAEFGDDVETPRADLLLPWLDALFLTPTAVMGRLR